MEAQEARNGTDPLSDSNERDCARPNVRKPLWRRDNRSLSGDISESVRRSIEGCLAVRALRRASGWGNE